MKTKKVKEALKDTTTIEISRDLRNDLMIFKVRSNARNLDEVIRLLISKLKEQQQLKSNCFNKDYQDQIKKEVLKK